MNDLIEQVSSFKDDVLKRISNRDIINFKIRDISFDDKIHINGITFTNNSINKIFSSLRVKDNFIKYKDKMDVNDWIEIEEMLKGANENMEFIGKKVTNSRGNESIVKLYQKNDISILNNYSIGFQNYFDMILLSLEGTQKNLSLKNASFNEHLESVNLRFIDNSTKVDALGDMSDIWKHGCDLTFDLLQYNSAPFFERQICTNGMVAAQLGFKTNIKNRNLNESRIQKEINKLLMSTTDLSYQQMIQDSVSHLKKYDVSIKEFYYYKDFFTKKNDNEQYNHILSKVFNDTDLFKSYGVDLEKQSDKWLASATSGRNAYDFLNDITYIASHSSESRMDDEDAKELQKTCSNLFFKEHLDLEDIAPKVNLKLGKVFVSNN